MGAVLLDDCVIGHHSIVGACALITSKIVIPPHSLVLGSPAHVVRKLSEAEVSSIGEFAARYIELKDIYLGRNTPSVNPFYERDSPDP